MFSLFLVGLIFFLVFLSCAEIAFEASNKLEAEVLKNKGEVEGQIISEFYEEPSVFEHTIAIGKAAILILITILLYSNSQSLTILSRILLTTFIIVISYIIFGDIIPRKISHYYSSGLIYRLARVLKFFMTLMSIPIHIVRKSTDFIANLFFSLPTAETQDALSLEDLEEYINESVDEEQDIDKEILTNALNMGFLKVRDCMIPRIEIVSIDKSESIAEAIRLFKLHKISRIIVINDDLENVEGYIHHQKLLSNPKKLSKIIMPITFIPEAMALPETLRKFMLNRTNIAMVVDEFGSISGLITLEDILEEIFGEIDDEHDEVIYKEEITEEGHYLFSGRLEIGYLNEKYPDLQIPEGEYQTLSGYIVTTIKDIPDLYETITLKDLQFTMEEMNDTRIEIVRIRVNPR